MENLVSRMVLAVVIFILIISLLYLILFIISPDLARRFFYAVRYWLFYEYRRGFERGRELIDLNYHLGANPWRIAESLVDEEVSSLRVEVNPLLQILRYIAALTAYFLGRVLLVLLWLILIFTFILFILFAPFFSVIGSITLILYKFILHLGEFIFNLSLLPLRQDAIEQSLYRIFEIPKDSKDIVWGVFGSYFYSIYRALFKRR